MTSAKRVHYVVLTGDLEVKDVSETKMRLLVKQPAK